MAINAYGYGSYGAARTGMRFVAMRREFDDLSRQLATGQRSATYGGLGPQSGTSLDLRAKLSALEGYRANIESADVRIKLMSQGVETLARVSTDMRAALTLDNFSFDADGRTVTQRMAREQLELAREVLNQESGGRYLFAGRSPEKPPVAALEDILNGAGGRLGLAQMIPERVAADRGPGNLGHATIANPAATSLSVATTDAARLGIKIAGIAETLTGATATFGTAAGVTTARLDFTADPLPGETFRLDIELPDGTLRQLTFTAEAAPGSGAPNSFVIGGGAAASRDSANAAITSAIAALVTSGDMQSSSAIAASRELFGQSPQNPLPPGSYSAPVVDWYLGDDGTQPPARDTALVAVGAEQSVGIGARANEPAFAELMAQLAVLSVESFSDTPADKARFQGFVEKIDLNLAPSPEEPGLRQVAVELGFAQAALSGADERHAASEAMIEDALGAIEQAPKEEVAAMLLALQTRLQASYQTTAMLSQLSLVNYL